MLEHYSNCVGKSSKLRAQIDIDVSALVKCIHMLPGVRGDGQSLLPNFMSSFNFKLPDLTSRSKNLLHAKIDPPDDDLIFAIVLKNFSDRQIKLEKKIIVF